MGARPAQAAPLVRARAEGGVAAGEDEEEGDVVGEEEEEERRRADSRKTAVLRWQS